MKWLKKIDDQKLVTYYKDTVDEKCIAIWYERYAHLCLGVGLKYLRNEWDAKEMVLHLFSELGGKIQKYEIKNFRSWLYSVTINECRMKLRKKNHEICCDDFGFVSAPSMEYNENIYSESDYLELEKKINELNEEQRTCVSLFYLKQKSYKEIELITGLSQNKIKSAIQNGKRNLKIQLENSHEFKK